VTADADPPPARATCAVGEQPRWPRGFVRCAR
jgi:hypothetical protein